MARQKKRITEYRNYPLPATFPILLAGRERNKFSNVIGDTLRFHNCMEFAVCHEGCGVVEFYDGKMPYKKDDVVIIPKNVPHMIRTAKGIESCWSYIYMDIDEIVKSVSQGSGAINMSISWEALLPENRLLNEKNNPYIYNLINNILKEMEQKNAGFQFSVRGLTVALFVELARMEQRDGRNNNGNIGLREKKNADESLAIAPALKYIDENYMHNFKTEQLAMECHLSPTHFRRIFNNTMETSPLEYLNNVRILKACNMLKNTEESILLISEKVGFRSVSSFNRTFLRTMQCSPREYRKNTEVEADK